MGMGLGTLVRLLLAAVILGIPTFLMGGTLPAAARAVVSANDISRRSLGALYGVNTLGAVTGAIAGTFYLFENLGNHATLWWATALNVVVALIALRLSKSMPNLKSDSERLHESNDEESHARTRPVFAFCAAGLVGFVGLVVPHIARRLGARGHRALLLASALTGAMLVVLADLVARVALPPAELPLGAVTAVLGVPFFLVTLRRLT